MDYALLRCVLFLCLCSSFALGAGPVSPLNGRQSSKKSAAPAPGSNSHMQLSHIDLPPWEAFLTPETTSVSRANRTSWDHKRASMTGVPLPADARSSAQSADRRKVAPRRLLPTSEGVPISPVAVPKSDPARTTFHFQPPANWMNDPNGESRYRTCFSACSAAAFAALSWSSHYRRAAATLHSRGYYYLLSLRVRYPFVLGRTKNVRIELRRTVGSSRFDFGSQTLVRSRSSKKSASSLAARGVITGVDTHPAGL
jgi:hypothetical protein